MGKSLFTCLAFTSWNTDFILVAVYKRIKKSVIQAKLPFLLHTPTREECFIAIQGLLAKCCKHRAPRAMLECNVCTNSFMIL